MKPPMTEEELLALGTRIYWKHVGIFAQREIDYLVEKINWDIHKRQQTAKRRLTKQAYMKTYMNKRRSQRKEQPQ
jgi:hypothetical protein